MRKIHVALAEYDSFEELLRYFRNMPSDMKTTGVQLASSKEKAEKNLQYQYDHFKHLGARVFWCNCEELNGVKYFILTEVLFD